MSDRVQLQTKKQFQETNNYLTSREARNLYWDADINISCLDLNMLCRLKEIPGTKYRGNWFYKREDILADITQLKTSDRRDRVVRRVKKKWVAAAEDVYYEVE